jgi:hypothetical protein
VVCHFEILNNGLLLTMNLLNQGSLEVRWKSSLRKIDSRHHNLANCYEISMSQKTTDMFRLSCSQYLLRFIFHDLSLNFLQSSATSGAGIAYLPRHLISAPRFSRVCIALSVVLSTIVCLLFFFLNHCIISPSIYSGWLPIWYF